MIESPSAAARRGPIRRLQRAVRCRRPAEPHNPRLVFTLHDISAHGDWQRVAADLFSQVAIPVATFDLGFSSIPSLLFSQQFAVEKFYEFFFANVAALQDVDLADPARRPSAIALGLGSGVLGKCLLKHRDVRLDKIVLVGSVLPRDFDWQVLIARDQVGSIWNQLCEPDFISTIAQWWVTGAGTSGHEVSKPTAISFIKREVASSGGAMR